MTGFDELNRALDKVNVTDFAAADTDPGGVGDLQWYDDADEVLAFAKFFFDTGTVRTTEILYYFEKPWKWTPEYEAWRKGDVEVLLDAGYQGAEEEALRDRNVMRDGTPYQI